MGKNSTPRNLADNEARAVGRMIRTSPQKLNLVAQLIRGKKKRVAHYQTSVSRVVVSRSRLRRFWRAQSQMQKIIIISMSIVLSSAKLMLVRIWS
jgi:ribosomal protein L22